MHKVLFISSLGGHLEQLLSLNDVMLEYDSSIVTEKNFSTLQLKNKYSNIFFLPYVSRRNIFTFLCSFIKISFNTLVIFFKQKPDVIITTGSGCVIPMFLLGKIFGKKLIFIETFSRIDSKTLTGKLCYYIADIFVIQWEELKLIYPKAVYLGSIY